MLHRSPIGFASIGKLLLANATLFQIPIGAYSIIKLKSEKYLDSSAFTSFGLLSTACIGLYKPKYLGWHSFVDLRKFISFWYISAWAMRLRMQQSERFYKNPNGDERFDNIRNNPLKFSMVWLMQIVWISITIAPHLLVIANNPFRGIFQLLTKLFTFLQLCFLQIFLVSK